MIMDNPDTMDITKDYSFEFYEETLDSEKTIEIIIGRTDHVNERIIPSEKADVPLMKKSKRHIMRCHSQ